jgi:hypothetical protein
MLRRFSFGFSGGPFCLFRDESVGNGDALFHQPNPGPLIKTKIETSDLAGSLPDKFSRSKPGTGSAQGGLS